MSEKTKRSARDISTMLGQIRSGLEIEAEEAAKMGDRELSGKITKVGESVENICTEIKNKLDGKTG